MYFADYAKQRILKTTRKILCLDVLSRQRERRGTRMYPAGGDGAKTGNILTNLQ